MAASCLYFVTLEIKSHNERQMSVYLGLKHCTDPGGYPNSVPASRVKARVFYEEKEGD